jgi:hypothetical protein
MGQVQYYIKHTRQLRYRTVSSFILARSNHGDCVGAHDPTRSEQGGLPRYSLHPERPDSSGQGHCRTFVPVATRRLLPGKGPHVDLWERRQVPRNRYVPARTIDECRRCSSQDAGSPGAGLICLGCFHSSCTSIAHAGFRDVDQCVGARQPLFIHEE